MDNTLLVISLLSLLLAAVMSVFAWRMVRDERLRSAARVAALAAEIHDPDARAALGSGVSLNTVPSPATSEMFAAGRKAATSSRLALAAVFGVLVVGAAVAMGIFSRGQDAAVKPAASAELSSGTSGSSVEPASAARGEPQKTLDAVPQPKTLPLELVALGHERDARGLTVRGVLRNPAGGTEIEQLTAVVLLFNREGGYIASGRAAVGTAKLSPGGETTFMVTIAGAPDVQRYRVSFRTARDVVPHVDVRS
jgi:hypothetical protein